MGSTSNADAAGLPDTGETPGAGGGGTRFTTTRRRWLQLGLAAIWVIDGLLQYQSYMFTKSLGTQILAPTAQGNPAWISDSILWAARIVEANPVSANAGFATLQLFIGLAIAYRRTLKPALVVSIIWSLLVWWFGEGLGGILLPGSSALMGAPGAVLLYALLAVLLWPSKEGTVGSFVAVKPVGRTAANVVWVLLWGGLAALNLEPANLTAQGVYTPVDIKSYRSILFHYYKTRHQTCRRRHRVKPKASTPKSTLVGPLREFPYRSSSGPEEAGSWRCLVLAQSPVSALTPI
ncbi:MAG: hypothetical protein M3021_06220 [Actinomycetota bacterium]|nr:hypothetical protein [Actinomycetota bacterium]